MTDVYNPLDKLNLAKSIEGRLLAEPPIPLSRAGSIQGAGIYVIYYAGPFPAYSAIKAVPPEGRFDSPIYIGKAIPKGGRKGGLTKDAAASRALADRLGQHAASIHESVNLELADFWVRHLVVDDIWIPLGENVLIQTFRPVWNGVIDGFGNKDPGKGRTGQLRSPWDVLHPGRIFVNKLADSPVSAGFLDQRVKDFLAKRPLAPLPKQVREQMAEEVASAEDAADDA